MQECPNCHSVIIYEDNYCQFCGADIRGLYSEGDWSRPNSFKEFKKSSIDFGFEAKQIIQGIPLIWGLIVFLFIIIFAIILSAI